MMTLPANTAQNYAKLQYGEVDLEQSTKAYQVFVNSLALHNNVEAAVQAANNFLAQDYPNVVAPPNGIRPPQVVFKSIGNLGVCLYCQ
jgi:hypothetical protein